MAAKSGFNNSFKDGTGGMRGGPGNASSGFQSSEKRIIAASVWADSVPIGYWDMSDGSGVTVSDVSSADNNLDGTMDATDPDPGPAWDSTNKVRGDYSLLFADGDNDAVIMADNNALDFAVDDPFSISCWVKRNTDTGGAYSGLVVKMAQGTQLGDRAWEGYALYLNGSTRKQPVILLYEGTGNPGLLRVYGGTNPISDTNWHNLVVTYNGNADEDGINMYLDGSPLGTSTPEEADSLEVDDDMLTSTSLVLGAILNNVGVSPPTRIYPYSGNMDEVAIWNKELSSDEIDDVYNSGAGNDLTDGIPKS